MDGRLILMMGLIQTVCLRPRLIVWCARNDELEPTVVNMFRHVDRASRTICMDQDLTWQLEWGPRVVTDVFEGPRFAFIQLLQFQLHPAYIRSLVCRCCPVAGHSLHNGTCSFQSICIRTHNSQSMHPECHSVFQRIASLLRLSPKFLQLVPIRL
jgi:hypothetical protein